MVLWEKCYLEGSEEASKKKYISPEKCFKVQTKNNPDNP